MRKNDLHTCEKTFIPVYLFSAKSMHFVPQWDIRQIHEKLESLKPDLFQSENLTKNFSAPYLHRKVEKTSFKLEFTSKGGDGDEGEQCFAVGIPNVLGARRGGLELNGVLVSALKRKLQ